MHEAHRHEEHVHERHGHQVEAAEDSDEESEDESDEEPEVELRGNESPISNHFFGTGAANKPVEGMSRGKL